MTRDEGNKLIRVFMGLPETSEIVKGDKLVPYCGHYDSQWGELMPVVEKIEAMGNIFTISENYCNIQDGKTSISITNIMYAPTKKEVVYKAVIQFIQWYNQTSLKSNEK